MTPWSVTNMCLAFAHSWLIPPKALELPVPRAVKVSCGLEPLRMRAGWQDERVELAASAPISREGRGTGSFPTPQWSMMQSIMLTWSHPRRFRPRVTRKQVGAASGSGGSAAQPRQLRGFALLRFGMPLLDRIKHEAGDSPHFRIQRTLEEILFREFGALSPHSL